MSDTNAPQVSDENALDMTSKLHAGNNGKANGNGAAHTLAVGEPAAGVPVAVKAYPFWTGVRFLVITLLGFLGTVNLYALRVNLSIALPCMVFINVTKNESRADVPAGCFREPTNNNGSDPSKVRFPELIASLYVLYDM